MTLNLDSRFLSLIAVFLGLGCSGNMQQITGCESDSQCPGGQICQASSGKCVPPPTYTTVNVVLSGDGSGTVTSSPAGINCGTTCSGMFEVGAQLTLTATPASGSAFGSFSIGCSSATPTCNLTPSMANTPIKVLVNFSASGPSAPPALCNSYNFCWENPKPVGNRLNSAVVVSPSELWAVGDVGTIVHGLGGNFSLVSSGTTSNLYGLSGNTTDLYAVGAAGTILHGQGGNFASNSSGVSTDLNSVWAPGIPVIAVGAGGTILRSQGTGVWTADQSHTTAALNGVFGNSISDIWAVGAQGTADHYDGAMWTASMPASFGTSTMRAVAGGSGLFYAIDSFGGVYSYTNATWAQARLVPTDDLYGVAIIAGTPYAAGNNDGGLIMHLSGNAWVRDVTASAGFRSIAGSGISDIWSVGETGLIWQYDGTTWQQRSSGLTTAINSIWATDAQNAWAVGAGGSLLYYNGSYFSPLSAGGSTNLNGVWASSPSDVWVVGAGGTILHYDGTNWTPSSSGTSQNLNAVYGLSSSLAWAVGDSGTALAWNGHSWTTVVTGSSANLHAVWGSSASDVWTVGDLGKVLHSTGSSFTTPAAVPATTATLSGLWGNGVGDVWITAATMLFHYQGSAWTPVNPTVAVTGLRGIWGTSSSDMYTVGQGGVLLHYNGSSLSPMSTGAESDLYAVMASQHKLWLAGANGTILRGSN